MGYKSEYLNEVQVRPGFILNRGLDKASKDHGQVWSKSQEGQKGGDPFLTSAWKQHEAKMRILQLKEWKLKSAFFS